MAIASGQGRLFALLRNLGIWDDLHSVCELGSQEPRHNDLREVFTAFKRTPLEGKYTARQLYEHLGIHEYVSIDINGQHGAQKFDLNERLPKIGLFDLVTNFGTANVVFNQFEVWRNIHELCKVGGCMIHTLPSQGWGREFLYKYDGNLVVDLATANGYEILLLEPFLRLGNYPHASRSKTTDKIRTLCAFIDTQKLGDATAHRDAMRIDRVRDALNSIGQGRALFNVTLACALRKTDDREFVTPLHV